MDEEKTMNVPAGDDVAHEPEPLPLTESSFRALFEKAPIGIFQTTSRGQVRYVNTYMAHMVGAASPREAIDRYPDISRQLYADPDRRLEFIRQLFQAGEVVGFEYEAVRLDGEHRWFSMSARISERCADGSVVIDGFTADITDIKQMQLALRESEQRHGLMADKLNQAQKMEAVGRLAGGVAHDFNNLLSIILGYAESILEELPAGDPLHDALKEIFDAGSRATQLTRQLLVFSRKQALELIHSDINAVITRFEKLLRRVIGEDIDLKLALSPETLFVKCDVSQIEQVLMNLAVNARDAMPHGGCLTIATSRVLIGDSRDRRHTDSAPGHSVRIEVSDTGTGMERNTLERIFEPFFTTKDKDHGTGLGLATSYGIVHQHGGTIEVFSKPGQGSRFTILLPMVEGGPVPERVPAEPRAQGTTAATILIVEDDPSVRKLAINILNKRGYRVIESQNVHEALTLAARQPHPIDLLLTDVVMPGMMGPEVFRKVAALHPNLKVLYMSGYTYNILAQHGVPEDGRQLLPKPFTVKALVDKVQEVLNPI